MKKKKFFTYLVIKQVEYRFGWRVHGPFGLFSVDAGQDTYQIFLDRVHSNLDHPQQDEEEDEEGEGQEQSEESKGEMAATAQSSAAKAPKRRSRDVIEEYLERKEAREQQRAREREERDDIHCFLMSLAPAMRRLSLDKQSWLKIKMQEMVYEAEFGGYYPQPQHTISQFTQL